MVHEIGSLIGRLAAEHEKLLPALARALGQEGVTAIFRDEHREILALRDELGAARDDGGDVGRVAAAALRLADLLGSHMAREDRMLFPDLRRAVKEADGGRR